MRNYIEKSLSSILDSRKLFKIGVSQGDDIAHIWHASLKNILR
jgi:hypothetical protein